MASPLRQCLTGLGSRRWDSEELDEPLQYVYVAPGSNHGRRWHTCMQIASGKSIKDFPPQACCAVFTMPHGKDGQKATPQHAISPSLSSATLIRQLNMHGVLRTTPAIDAFTTPRSTDSYCPPYAGTLNVIHFLVVRRRRLQAVLRNGLVVPAFSFIPTSYTTSDASILRVYPLANRQLPSPPPR